MLIIFDHIFLLILLLVALFCGTYKRFADSFRQRPAKTVSEMTSDDLALVQLV